MIVEKYSRGKSQYFHTSQIMRNVRQQNLFGLKSFFAFSWCSLIVLVSSIIPIIQLLLWFFDTYFSIFEYSYFQLIWNTTWIAGISSLIIVFISMSIPFFE